MKIGGTPPGGDNFRIPEPDGPKTGKTEGSKDTRFGEKLEGAGKGAGEAKPAGRAEGAQAEKLRAVLDGIDRNAPDAVEQAAGRMVDWVLSERFGEEILNAKGAEGLRESVRDQLLADPNGLARIRQILERI